MKYLFFILLSSTALMAQPNPTKTIEVSGSHEMSIDPETIYFNITIEEYWQEEFEGKKWEDFKTKIDITTIENELIKELKSIDVKMDQITLKQSGNYWRSRGKDFLISKNLEIKLNSFEKANEISNELKARGIKNMNVARLDHSDLKALELQVKAEALKDAREKAATLANVYGKKIKDVVSIVEVDKFVSVSPPMYAGLRAKSMAMESSNAQPVQYENFRQIKLSADMRVLFEIE